MRRSWLTALLTLLTLLALPWLLATAPPSPEPSPEPAPTPSPTSTYASPGEAAANAWLREEGAAVITSSEGSGLTADQLASVQWAPPVQASTWTESYLAGDLISPATVLSDTWLAPLVVNGTGVGALEIRLEAGRVTGHREVWIPELSDALRTHAADRFVLEEGDVVFRISGDTARPVGPPAHELLAGRISVQEFQPFVAARHSPDEEPLPESDGEPSRAPVIAAAILLGGVLALAGLLTWSRRPEGTP
ncbi:MAG: hypothetical protein Q4G64_01065 [bacterium]|nr:hypothetical protein [bacterium]